MYASVTTHIEVDLYGNYLISYVKKLPLFQMLVPTISIYRLFDFCCDRYSPCVHCKLLPASESSPSTAHKTVSF